MSENAKSERAADGVSPPQPGDYEHYIEWHHAAGKEHEPMSRATFDSFAASGPLPPPPQDAIASGSSTQKMDDPYRVVESYDNDEDFIASFAASGPLPERGPREPNTSSESRAVGAVATGEAVEAQSPVTMQALVPASERTGLADPANGLPTSTDSAYWKAMHDQQVRLKRQLHDRYEAERAQSAERGDAAEQLAEAVAMLREVVSTCRYTGSAPTSERLRVIKRADSWLAAFSAPREES